MQSPGASSSSPGPDCENLETVSTRPSGQRPVGRGADAERALVARVAAEPRLPCQGRLALVVPECRVARGDHRDHSGGEGLGEVVAINADRRRVVTLAEAHVHRSQVDARLSQTEQPIHPSENAGHGRAVVDLAVNRHDAEHVRDVDLGLRCVEEDGAGDVRAVAIIVGQEVVRPSLERLGNAAGREVLGMASRIDAGIEHSDRDPGAVVGRKDAEGHGRREAFHLHVIRHRNRAVLGDLADEVGAQGRQQGCLGTKRGHEGADALEILHELDVRSEGRTDRGLVGLERRGHGPDERLRSIGADRRSNGGEDRFGVEVDDRDGRAGRTEIVHDGHVEQADGDGLLERRHLDGRSLRRRPCRQPEGQDAADQDDQSQRSEPDSRIRSHAGESRVVRTLVAVTWTSLGSAGRGSGISSRQGEGGAGTRH